MPVMVHVCLCVSHAHGPSPDFHLHTQLLACWCRVLRRPLLACSPILCEALFTPQGARSHAPAQRSRKASCGCENPASIARTACGAYRKRLTSASHTMPHTPHTSTQGNKTREQLLRDYRIKLGLPVESAANDAPSAAAPEAAPEQLEPATLPAQVPTVVPVMCSWTASAGAHGCACTILPHKFAAVGDALMDGFLALQLTAFDDALMDGLLALQFTLRQRCAFAAHRQLCAVRDRAHNCGADPVLIWWSCKEGLMLLSTMVCM
eukprot:1157909-Pelagomonas_calceolata.AAC.10